MTATFNLADLFEMTADAVPDRLALVAGDARLNYRELDERATRFGNHLRLLGLEPGSHVALLGWNSDAWMVAMLGAYKARLAVVNVNYRYTRPEVVDLLVDAEARVLVADSALFADLESVRDAVPTVTHLISFDARCSAAELGFADVLERASPSRDFGPRSGDDPYLLYTGGTTGRPKGVVWRSEDLFFASLAGSGDDGQPLTRPEQVAERLVPDSAPWLVTSPLMHGNGQWNSLRPLLDGSGVVLWTGRRFDASGIARLIAEERAFLLVLVGDGMAVPFLEAIEGDDTIDLGSLRVIASGGAILSPTNKERLQRRLPGCRIVDGFGASETGSGGVMVGGGSGLPRFTMTPDVAVLDSDLAPVAPGQTGLLARRGHIPLGYWNDPLKTAATFPTDRSGTRWAVPGDEARLESDGTVVLLGRGSTSINTGGEKVHPEEVANAIKTHPAVSDAIVVGVPDQRWGQAVAAVVTVVDGEHAPSVEQLRDHVSAHLASYKAPRHVVVVDGIDYTAQGKPDITWARDVATKRVGRH